MVGAPARGALRKFSLVSHWKALPVSLLSCVVQMVPNPRASWDVAQRKVPTDSFASHEMSWDR